MSALAFPACSEAPQGRSGKEEPASATIDFALALAPGVQINTVGYHLTGPNGYDLPGVIDVTNSRSADLFVGGMPAGTYTISTTAVSVDGNTTCAGTKQFSVSAGQTVTVTLPMQCSTLTTRGGVRVTTTFNSCPDITSMIVAPLTSVVGGWVDMRGTAMDRGDGPEPLTTLWTATSGTVKDPTSERARFKCGTPGTATVSLNASDGNCVTYLSADVQCIACGQDGLECSDHTACTVQDKCQSGICGGMPAAARTHCEGSGLCDGAGNCLECLTSQDCPGTDSACATRTCSVQGKCGVSYAPAGSRTPPQTIGDCQVLECDGAGNTVTLEDNGDLPIDGNACTSDLCNGGVPLNPALPAETSCQSSKVCDGMGACVECVRAANCAGNDTTCASRTCTQNLCGVQNTAEGVLCTENSGQICNGAGSCVKPTFRVLRVGSGTGALSQASTAVFIERRLADGTLVGTDLALPTALNGANRAFTLPGLAPTEGDLARSSDGRYLLAAGFASVPGVANISLTDSSAVPRVVGRIDAAGTINTSTLFNSAFSQGTARSVTSIDGSGFWASGVGTATPNPSGIWYIPFGVTGGTQILASTMRWTRAAGDQLFGSGTTTPLLEVFKAGSGLPTSGPVTGSELPGMPTTAGPSPWGFVFFDRDASVAGLDTLYVADDRGGTGRGVQKWTFNGSVWSLIKTMNLASPVGFRGLAGLITGPNVMLMASTVEMGGVVNRNRLVVFVDDGAATTAGTVIVGTTNELLYRGVAPEIHP